MTQPKLEQSMGQRSAEFYAAHLDRVVNIMVSTGQVFKDALIGIEQYDLCQIEAESCH